MAATPSEENSGPHHYSLEDRISALTERELVVWLHDCELNADYAPGTADRLARELFKRQAAKDPSAEGRGYTELRGSDE
jgi:hypothetical protein